MLRTVTLRLRVVVGGPLFSANLIIASPGLRRQLVVGIIDRGFSTS